MRKVRVRKYLRVDEVEYETFEVSFKLSYKSAIVQTRRGINLNFRLQDTTLQSSKKYPDSVKNSRACHVT